MSDGLGRFLAQTSNYIIDLNDAVTILNVNYELISDIIIPISSKFSDEYNTFTCNTISGQEIYLNGIKLSPSGSNVDISNNTKNALVTVDGSNNTLYANSGLTYNPSGLLTVSGNIISTNTISSNIITANTLSGSNLYLSGVLINPSDFGLSISGTIIPNTLLQVSGNDQYLYCTSGLLYSNNILSVPTISGNTISGNTIFGNTISGSNLYLSGNLIARGNISGSNLTVSGVSTDNNGNLNLSGNVNALGTISGSQLYISGVQITGNGSVDISNNNTQYALLTVSGPSNTLYANSGLTYNPSGLLTVSGNIYSSGSITISGNVNANSLGITNDIRCSSINGSNGFSLDTSGNLHTNLLNSTTSFMNDQSGNIFTNGSVVVGKNIVMTPSGNLYGGNLILPTYTNNLQLPSPSISGSMAFYISGGVNYLAINVNGTNWGGVPLNNIT